MAAATTIPETVTAPGQLVYEALVRLLLIRNSLEVISDGASTLADEFNRVAYHLFEAAFGESYYIDDDLTEAPLVK